jgi:ABC-type multidrug transport system ATPase subunit
MQRIAVQPLLDVAGLEVRLGNVFRVGPASFAIGAGLVHVVGPNGGGKTTLLRALAGELIPHRGTVRVNGRSVHDSLEARCEVALVSSIPELPGLLTVTEAYQFVASLRRQPAWDGARFCARLQLDPNLPLGSASAGQRRKAELVCGLAADPVVLLLDETFAHLDDDANEVLRSWMIEWSGRRAIVFTHHGASPVPPSAYLRVDRGNVVFASA